MSYILHNCCHVNEQTPEIPVVPKCPDCFKITDPIISYDRMVGPCNEQFSVSFGHTTNCQSVEYEVIKSDPAFYDLFFVGNILYGKTHPNYIDGDITKTYKILVRGTCKSGSAVGFSSQGIVQAPVKNRCIGKGQFCDPCTGLVGPQPSEIIIDPTNNEIAL